MSEFRDMADAINARLASDRGDYWVRSMLARMWRNVSGEGRRRFIDPVKTQSVDRIDAGITELERLCAEYGPSDWEAKLEQQARENASCLTFDLSGARLDQRKGPFQLIAHLLRVVRWNDVDRYLSERINEPQRFRLAVHKKNGQSDDQSAARSVVAGVIEGRIRKGGKAAIMVVDAPLEAGDHLVLAIHSRRHLVREVRIHFAAPQWAGGVRP